MERWLHWENPAPPTPSHFYHLYAVIPLLDRSNPAWSNSGDQRTLVVNLTSSGDVMAVAGFQGDMRGTCMNDTEPPPPTFLEVACHCKSSPLSSAGLTDGGGGLMSPTSL